MNSEKCVIKYIDYETYFYSLDGLFASFWGPLLEAQVFNSEETAQCVIKELEKRHKANGNYKIVKVESLRIKLDPLVVEELKSETQVKRFFHLANAYLAKNVLMLKTLLLMNKRD